MKFVIEPDGTAHNITEEGYADHDYFFDNWFGFDPSMEDERVAPEGENWLIGVTYGDGHMWIGGREQAFKNNADVVYDLALEEGIETMEVHILQAKDPDDLELLISATPEEFKDLGIHGLIVRARLGAMKAEAQAEVPRQSRIEGYYPSGTPIYFGDRRPVHVGKHRRRV